MHAAGAALSDVVTHCETRWQACRRQNCRLRVGHLGHGCSHRTCGPAPSSGLNPAAGLRVLAVSGAPARRRNRERRAASITSATRSAAVPGTGGRRPILPAILPAASAPISRMLASSSLLKDVRPWKSLPMTSSAPAMTSAWQPDSGPPRAVIAAAPHDRAVDSAWRQRRGRGRRHGGQRARGRPSRAFAPALPLPRSPAVGHASAVVAYCPGVRSRYRASSRQ